MAWDFVGSGAAADAVGEKCKVAKEEKEFLTGTTSKNWCQTDV